jgi:2,4-dienoyl-CoA reductase [(3E)-enoyl-CoA-producing], peroxisomal
VRSAVGLQGDVRKPADTAAWAAAAAARGRGGIDILVNCAAGNFLVSGGGLGGGGWGRSGRKGSVSPPSIHQTHTHTPSLSLFLKKKAAADALSPNGFRTVMDIDAVGTFSTSRAAAAALKIAAARRAPAGCGGGGGGGSSSASGVSGSNQNTSDASGAVVINISATLHYGATWWQAHACAAKAAVDALTRALALEWGEAGVRVVGVAPGPVAGTAGLQKLAGVDAPGLTASVASMVPLGRLASAWDIAAACVFLASPAARFVSGDTLVVDGGAWLWRPPAVPRDAVEAVARRVEAASRAVTGAQAGGSKL